MLSPLFSIDKTKEAGLTRNIFLLTAAILISIGFVSGCGEKEKKKTTVVVPETCFTDRDETMDIDSPAIWHGPGGRHWLFATAKSADVVLVYDAVTGETIDTIGVSGTGEIQFDRPNGIAVFDSLLFVVERDNKRVQVLALPSFEFVSFIGDTILRRPYGIAGFKNPDKSYTIYITDNYETEDGQIPPDSLLDERVKKWSCGYRDGGFTSFYIGDIGEAYGIGVLHKVESVAVDKVLKRLLIADEQDLSYKIYDLAGSASGNVMGGGAIKYEPEGIVLYECPDTTGYWICSDQASDHTIFRIFDRRSLELIVSFRGAGTMNTDGICITQKPFGQFEQGAFFAVHDDGNVAAFDLGIIADSTGLKFDCVD
ncbi:MAG: phytase [candidate division Zixibacteria bacterium]|nr:phytase [candidate division Zixibacteria bacterium]